MRNIAANGTITNENGDLIDLDEIDSSQLRVVHLDPHVVSFTLPKGDTVKIKVRYSCHCWTEMFDPTLHDGQVKIMDGARARVFSGSRFSASQQIRHLLEGLGTNKIYLTPSGRNFGTYNATMALDDGTAYTAYFTLKKHKGKYDGIRHSLSLFVESAYMQPQPEQGQKVALAVILSKTLKGERVKFFRR